LLALGGITALGSLATHMFVPALPQAAAELGVAPQAMQQAISIYLLGLGLGQPVWGPLSDCFDRRSVLGASVLLFLAGTIAAAAAGSLEILLAARLVQAVGGAGTLIACRALVSAASAPGEGARSHATHAPIKRFSPARAPLCGSLIAAAAGWRSLFVLLALLAAAGLVLVRRLPAMPPAGERPDLTGIGRAYLGLLGNAGFVTAVAANALIVASFYIFLAASPFILGGLFRLSPLRLGLCYAAIAGAMLAGTLTLRFLGAAPRRLEAIGLTLLLAGSAWLGVEAWLSLDSALAFVLPLALLGYGSGLIAPLVLASALETDTRWAGSAASLFGSVQMLATALLSAAATLALHGADQIAAAIAASAAVGALLLVARRATARSRCGSGQGHQSSL
jgi:DHA1 family bicyclomycin/chloramphenicol resistance-like MFS transporter